nr:SWIM zinc finger family protein [Streptomyces avermitilis]
MPGELVDDARRAGVPLLPQSTELDPDCSCPDWGYPCKHAAALCYAIAATIDADPFVLFALRGRDREEVITQLRARRTAAQATSTPPAPAGLPAAGAYTAWGALADQPPSLPNFPNRHPTPPHCPPPRRPAPDCPPRTSNASWRTPPHAPPGYSRATPPACTCPSMRTRRGSPRATADPSGSTASSRTPVPNRPRSPASPAPGGMAAQPASPSPNSHALPTRPR